MRCGDSPCKLKNSGVNDDDAVSRKGPPIKVMWFLPIITRFKREFDNVNVAKNIIRHIYKRKCDEKIRHIYLYIYDSLQWMKIHLLFLDFGVEPRNIRLGLVTNGMNPFGNLNTNHTSWFVLLIIYNLSHGCA